MNKQKKSIAAFAKNDKIQVLKTNMKAVKGGTAAGDPPPFGENHRG